jgi:hypothetical protein
MDSILACYSCKSAIEGQNRLPDFDITFPSVKISTKVCHTKIAKIIRKT